MELPDSLRSEPFFPASCSRWFSAARSWPISTPVSGILHGIVSAFDGSRRLPPAARRSGFTPMPEPAIGQKESTLNLNHIPYSLRGRLFALCCLAGLALPALNRASAQNAPLRLTGHVPALVSRSVRTARVAATEPITLALVLPLRNRAELDDLVTGLYDLEDARYGAYLTSARFAA